MFNFGRKLLMGLTVVAGAVAATSGAGAATRYVSPVPVLSAPPVVQSVQYYDDWRHHDWRHQEWRRREAFERFQRREERRQWRHAQREYYGQGYGYRYDYGRRW